MTSAEANEIFDKITAGVNLAVQRVIEKAQKNDEEIVIARDGKILRLKARDLNTSISK